MRYYVLTKQDITPFDSHHEAFAYATHCPAYPRGVFQVVRTIDGKEIIAPVNTWAESWDILPQGNGIESLRSAHPSFAYTVI